MHKPIIGILGGVGSGKSFVARLFGELGCLVIDSDEQVRLAYQDPAVSAVLRNWWGNDVFLPDGSVNRKAIAAVVFSDSAQREKLEKLVHPWVAKARDEQMQRAKDDLSIPAFVWDTPLLLESGWYKACDALVFVDTPFITRLERVKQTRGWDEAELARREKNQSPLDKKQQIADYIVVNTADADDLRRQVREVLSRILAKSF